MKWKYLTAFLTAISNDANKAYTAIVGISLLTMAALSANAQTDSVRAEEIAVLARPSKDSIVLRWAPLTYRVWRAGNRNGYRLERFLIAKNGKLLDVPVKSIIQDTIRPWQEAEWEQIVQTTKYAPIAAQALFGERFEVDLNESDIFSIVNKIEENEQRFSFALFSADMSPQIAVASGIWYADRTINSGEKYLYRIIVNGPETYAGSAFIGSDDEYILPKLQTLRAEFNDRAVSLRWDRTAATLYTAFILERSLDGNTFSKVSDQPIVTLSPENRENQRYEYAIDSLPDNSTTYYYRVKGITPFGEEGPGSKIVSGRGIPAVRQVPYITSALSDNNSTIRIKWNFPEGDNSAIRGFRVERSSGPNEKYILLTPRLLTVFERQYEDTSPLAVNYYRVQAPGLDGQLYTSHAYFAQLVDSIPPQAPVGLRAVVDDQGKVSLSWTPNRDPDIYGYRIYRSWLLSEEPSQVTEAPISTSHFVDHVDINALNENVYYRLMALDVNQNHSALSEILRVSLPDIVRPQPPVILPSMLDSSGVSLMWIAGGSEDIVTYKIYRKDTDDKDWLSVAAINAAADSIYNYVDNNCPAGKQVYYTILSVDDSGLESEPAQPVSRTCLSPSLSPPVRWHKHQIIHDENRIKLFWTYNESAVESYLIIRSVNDDSPVVLQALDARNHEFTDTIIPGNIYTYRIMAGFQDGRKSALSEELKFQY